MVTRATFALKKFEHIGIVVNSAQQGGIEFLRQKIHFCVCVFIFYLIEKEIVNKN